MAIRSILFISLAVAIMAIPIAEAQLGGLISGLLGSINVKGIVFCTLDGNIGINGTATPVFSNALVQLQCGNGDVVSTTTTNSAGVFGFVLDPLQMLLSSLTTNCSVAVKTPLSTCNVNLPSVGGLQSPLKYVGDTVLGLLNIANLIPSGFRLIPGLAN
ncbi:phylloplanin-like [Coffea eugenioides]|uniref:Phylloplanin n=1 Tax=Coffea arabica TaxID=13443 RepID=A0A6P6X4P9_COFAR|nr:phylloplanin-like [Coffea arabica]XP_027167082.1 phylloplanin-like [Coffea eugenioides]